MRIAACIPTRGNVPLDDIIESLPEHYEVVVWDNSKRDDLGVYGRYAAIGLTDAELIYTQDDDCVLDSDGFFQLESHVLSRPTDLAANMPERFRPHYPDSCLVGFGALFHRSLPGLAFSRLGDATPPLFNLTCDVYFTTLSERVLFDLSYRDQPWASNDDRMWRQPTHFGTRVEALREARALR